MRKKKLGRCVILSLLIHLGLLAVIEGFLIPSPSVPEQLVLYPVSAVLIEDEKTTELPPVRLSSSEKAPPKEPIAAKAQPAMGTRTAAPMEDLPGPIPKEGSFKPSLSMEAAPTPGVLPAGQAGNEVQSERVVSHALDPPLRLPPVSLSPADQSPILVVEEGRVLTEADTGGIPVATAKPEKIAVPLGRNRPHPEWLADLPPIPTIGSPTLPEQKEMTLARKTTDLYAASSATLSPLPRVRPTQRIFQDQRDTQSPPPMDFLEPLIPALEGREPLLTGDQDLSVLLAVDTSGSVKGSPLDGIKQSATTFIELLRETDWCALIAFDDEARLVVPFTRDKSGLKQEIAGLDPKGTNTVLFDALDQAFSLLENENDTRRIVILFSDGKDEGSRLTLNEVLQRARKLRIPVFSVGYSRVERIYLTTLEDLSQETGAMFAEAPRFEEIVELFRTARERIGKGETPSADQRKRPT